MRIAINGIGVAGPTLAYWLHRSGHEPVLFEKAPALRTGGYMIDFWGVGYEVADRMGLVPGLRERSYLMERLVTVDARGRAKASVGLAPLRELLRGRFISLARSELSRAIFDACAGVEARFGLSIEGLEERGDAIAAVLSDGREERFDLVVGADGLHSRVREVTFGPEDRFENALGCDVAAFQVADYPHRDELTYVSHTAAGRHAARVSLRGDQTLILLIADADRIGGVARGASPTTALRRAFGGMGWEVPEMLDRMAEVEDVYFDRVSQIRLPGWSSGRVALVGDAAACPSLLAGEGTGLGMLEAYVLAQELDRANGDFVRAFRTYGARLHGFVTGKQKEALRLRGFFVPRTRLGLRFRDAAVRAMAIPFLARRLLGRALDENPASLLEG